MNADPDTTPSGEDRVRITSQPDDAWHRHTASFRYDSSEGWTATGTVTRTRRRGVVITDVRFEAPGDEDGAPGPVTSTALRQLPISDILSSAMQSGLLPQYPTTPPPKREPRPSGRAPLTDAHIRDVAETYLRETGPGKPRGALRRVAEHFGKPVPTASHWVQRARADGWLGPAVTGREGGEPGPRLLQARQDEEAIRAAAEQESAQQSGKLPFMSITMEEHARRMQQIAPAMGRINALLNALAPPAPKKADEPVEHDAE